ncbi:MAG: DUF5686 family protein [Rikenellaceae bacterium]
MRTGFKIIITLALYLSCCTISARAQKDSIYTIDNVEITAQHKRYNKHNPATELLERLRQSIAESNPYKQDFAEYARYEKLVVSINDFQAVDSTKTFAFLNPHATVNPYTNKTILPISLHHRIVNTTIRKHRQKRDTTTFYQKSGIDDYFSQTTVLTFLNDIIPEINLFNEDVYFASRKFISPLSKKAQNFYQFFLAPDTIELDSRQYVELFFFPQNNNAHALRGRLTVEVDSTKLPSLVEADFTIPESANLNFMGYLQINIKYAQDSCGMTVTTEDFVTMDISTDKNLSLANITRESLYSHFAYAPHQLPDSVLRVDSIKFKPDEAELLTKELSKKLRRRALWVIVEEVALILTEDYFQTSKPKSYFDIGPVSKFLTINELEGTKISVGGVTTPNISPNIFFSGIISYGFGDNKIMGSGTLEWSFTPKKEYISEYPSNSLAATVSYDSKRFSDGFDRKGSSRGILDGISRHQYDDLVYQRLYQLRYHKEWLNNMSLKAYGRYYNTYDTPIFQFAPTSTQLHSYNMSEVELRLGFAPGQKFIQTRTSRYDLHKYIGRFELSHTTAFKGLLGGNYSRNLTTLSGEGRINVQPLGYIDIKGEGGIEWNEVPYMLLPYPKTNTSYFIGNIDYFSMMMPQEFFYDRYIYIGIDYHLDGLIFNHIPLINKLRLREVFTFRGVYGELSDKNNPLINKNLLSLPSGSSALGREPYIELGVGIDNILSIFSINYVWRVTYRDNSSLGTGAILFNSVIKF